MTFDPFEDFEARGYLRNRFGEKDPQIIRRLEHSSFVAGINAAFRHLSSADYLTYSDVLKTHEILFGEVYPWAGHDRSETSPHLAISKAGVVFAHPDHAKMAVDHALRLGQDKALMASKPGDVLGYLAHGHPFLDGNGRTILVIHTELSERAGIGIDWAATDKRQYLIALTHELENPGNGHLDAYLAPLVGSAIGRARFDDHVTAVPGLDGVAKQSQDEASRSDAHAADTFQKDLNDANAQASRSLSPDGDPKPRRNRADDNGGRQR